MKVSLPITLSLAAILGAGLSASAQPGRETGPGPGGPGAGPGFGMHQPPLERALGMRGGRWWNDPALIEKLKITDDQRKAMDQILLDHREKLVDMHAALEKAEIGLEPLVQDDQPNEGRILAQIDKVAQARAELEKANARFLLAIRAKLSPEQWKELKAARNERMDRRGWREHREGGKRPGAPLPGGPGGGPQGTLNEPPLADFDGSDSDTGTR